MLDFDSLREIFSTIRKNKMRTFLTGLAVAFGIFMLIILLGAGNGLKNGVMSNFSHRALNSVSIWPGWTSMPYKGMPSNREIKFDDKDYDLIKNKIPEVEYISARTYQTQTISYEKEYGSWTLMGVSPDAAIINNIEIKGGKGRFLNQMDIENRRKVAVINTDMESTLFKGENPIGKYIIAGNLAFQVIGVFEQETHGNNQPAYIPFTTAQTLYNKGYGFGRIDFTVKGLNTIEANEAFNERLREKLGALHNFDPKDRSALSMWNTAQDAIETETIFKTITIFLIFIGICSLVAGIVGVANIMLITVKERTREIGIRKAIGATPSSILRLIIFESILITTTAGYFGMVSGIALTEAIGAALSGGGSSDGPSVFMDPTVDLTTAISAIVALVICGVVAGLIPAIKATKVSPIEAMRAE
ncbi:ABC transporter permease [Dysgonomonas sp. 216]|uniref:ABC transporter permease n=1 Tax=Dysgonomonas sp. 216 TaxID=2302934 RepID=UPI0013D8AAF7|nr:ABC transporter permease [Dysgonomonas sp. 216]NDW19043.1 ABC transporter permease [Dysgonomonas sp. 216]